MSGRNMAIAAAAFIACLALYSYLNPASEAGIRLINHKADSHELAKVAQADPKLQKLVGGDDRQFGNALKQFGSEDGARRADREAALARAENAVPITPAREVRGNQTNWEFAAPVYEPMHITVPPDDKIIPPWRTDEAATADGIEWNGSRHRFDQTVLMKEQNAPNPNARTGRLDELIGRLCHGSSCGPGFPMGSDSVVCATGDLQLWRNGLVVQDQVPMLADFGAGGRYRYSIVPDEIAKSTCATHQNETVIHLSGTAL